MMSMNALNFHDVKFQAPNVFIVSFPVPAGTTISGSKTLCEKEQPKIAAALEKVAGRPVSIRFDLATVEAPERPTQQKNVKNDAQLKYKLLAELADHPMIQKARDIFGAELVNVEDR